MTVRPLTLPLTQRANRGTAAQVARANAELEGRLPVTGRRVATAARYGPRDRWPSGSPVDLEGRLMHLGIGGAGHGRQQIHRMSRIVGAGGPVLTRAVGAVADDAFHDHAGLRFDPLDGRQQLLRRHCQARACPGYPGSTRCRLRC